MHLPLRSPSTRGSLMVAALLLVALLAGTGHAPIVKAADRANIDVRLWAQRVGGNETVCVGDEVKLQLMVPKRIGVEGDYTLAFIGGITVDSWVGGNGLVGHLTPTSATTTYSRIRPSALFLFVADKPGSVVLHFTAHVTRDEFLGFETAGDTVKADFPIEVVDCKYQVSATSEWTVPGEANIRLLAHIEVAGMADDGTGRLHGTARVEWFAVAAEVGNCQGILPPASEADVDGEVDEDEVIVVITYEPANIPITISCAGIGGTKKVQVQPEHLSMTLPAEGGKKTLDHLLHGPEDTPGRVVVIVRRVTGE
jgi:hypothetical protein